jgi:hypothetical protein
VSSSASSGISADSSRVTSPQPFTQTGADPSHNNDLLKIRLNQIAVKYLTLIELKYLKQLCFNKVKKQLELALKQQQPFVNSTNLLNYSSGHQQSNHHSAANFKLTIPKDESMKTVKAKNIATSRSKSVDFRFFEEIKENYLFKRSLKVAAGGSGASGDQNTDGCNLVFGQSLYKCILNDLSHSASQRAAAATAALNKNVSGSAIGGKAKSKLNTSSVNPNKVLIASKFDMDVLNVISKNPNVVANGGGSTRVLNSATVRNLSNEAIVNKRNSVLFEALDLKNVALNANSGVSSGHVSKANRFLNFKSSSAAHQSPATMDSIEEEQQRGRPSAEAAMAAAQSNPNFSIRSEGLVPNIVKSCCKHISERGLDLVGIFRIESSKKRIKELREMFDCGKPINLDDDAYSSNDVACILKEYLRSLQEPLLTRDLYASFLATTSKRLLFYDTEQIITFQRINLEKV